ncbi:hypothetical protein BT96DRAFT_856068 [Gymnopus androsaceus JB14]|uniref:CHY-type domain-containing protein n=1 Tax=Gymnopus androsaceus JB14 TaxID=1447944 RepID=A0A6A4HW40_9AGAR|nr:hypothetical protein BT96DRAFT_856068 [Gymnopus androsaceus JB14]
MLVTSNFNVHGIDVRPHTQCAHWHSSRDIIAIRHKCCGEYYACISCHEALAGHKNQVWPKDEWGPSNIVLCGKCLCEMSVVQYLGCDNHCPSCKAEFNPGCRNHYHLYFEDKMVSRSARYGKSAESILGSVSRSSFFEFCQLQSNNIVSSQL